ncbi:MAG: hypothetical protein KU38_09740 [Sulfurovum sp. FS08-3]|nr:MAG: hypothetical protein KU38_09740 [Sulfurovum sp. FS08-3]
MQTIQFTINDKYTPTILSLLQSLKEGIISDLSIQGDSSQPLKPSDSDIFSKTAGILHSQKIDPIEWQETIRSEWDR